MTNENNTFTLADYEMDNTDLLVGDRDFGSDKEYKLNGQFKMHITRMGKPFASKFNGLPQVPTTVQAVDSDGNIVGEETTIWLTLPVTPKDANDNQVKDALKARDELIGILRAKSDEFSAYRKEGSGKDARYYAPDGTQLTGKQICRRPFGRPAQGCGSREADSPWRSVPDRHRVLRDPRDLHVEARRSAQGQVAGFRPHAEPEGPGHCRARVLLRGQVIPWSKAKRLLNMSKVTDEMREAAELAINSKFADVALSHLVDLGAEELHAHVQALPYDLVHSTLALAVQKLKSR
jgi:hypothetical protein